MTLRCFALSAALICGNAAPALAAPTPLCRSLQRIIAAASDTPSFASISRKAPGGMNGTLIPTGFDSCLVSLFSTPMIPNSYGCSSKAALAKAAAPTRLSALNAEITACLGVRPVEPDMMHNRGEGHMDYFVKVPNGLINVYTLAQFKTAEQRTLVIAVSLKVGG